MAVYALALSQDTDEHRAYAVVRVGPYLDTHSRHFAQKADYTFCHRMSAGRAIGRFASHAEFYAADLGDSDPLVKFTLPSTERKRALEALDDYNISYFTLFQTEDALVKSLATKELVLTHLTSASSGTPAG